MPRDTVSVKVPHDLKHRITPEIVDSHRVSVPFWRHLKRQPMNGTPEILLVPSGVGQASHKNPTPSKQRTCALGGISRVLGAQHPRRPTTDLVKEPHRGASYET